MDTNEKIDLTQHEQPGGNPLLDFSHLPRFDQIKPDHVTPAIDQLLADAREVVSRITADDSEVTWDAVVEPLNETTDRLARAWGAVSHMNAVVDTPPLREQYNANLPKLTEFWTELSQNVALYQKFKALAAAKDFAEWPDVRRKVVQNELRDFRLGGAELAPDQKDRFKKIREREAQVSTRFSENVLDATNAFALYVDDASALAGVPQDALQMLAESAEADGRRGYKISLQYPSYSAIVDYAHDRALRQQMYRAYSTKASEFGNPEWNNGPLMVELLKLRREHAQLLGYKSFAEVSLVAKMAESPADVLDFLRDLARRAKPYAERDIAELRDFAAKHLGIADLQPWDVSYASEKLREQRYSYSEQELKQYFSEPRVLAGLFKVIETLFAVAIREETAPVWHPDVRFFRIENLRGQLVGEFYLDIYARDHKQGGAWQGDARSRRARRTTLATPVSFLTCNFSRPAGGKPATLKHDEVLTLFHEFGHGLHHMLTRVDEPSVSGIQGVEWDAVELPSQFMENFAWEWEVLQMLTGHADTGEKLPRALFEKMLAAKNFQSGMFAVRQLEFALFDMLLHSGTGRPDEAHVMKLLADVRREVSVLVPPEYNRFPHAFSHIFAGGYAAGYYSYKWAEVLSADAYSAFEENKDGGVLSPEIGSRFLDEVLAVGGSRPAMQSFVAFRGRKPTIDALLRHNGMVS
ncbi:MAG TPA: M3 family metallopeptidase [Burkholderiaceae bacterium]|nr:M3 family metallopeptidase [Burkholderiaceae bacterium]